MLKNKNQQTKVEGHELEKKEDRDKKKEMKEEQKYNKRLDSLDGRRR